MSLEFTVRGSAVEPYAVRFWREGTTLHSSCTCQGASRGLACKHRLDLLAGDITQLIAGSTADVQRLRELSAGTEVERAFSSSPTLCS